MDGREDEPTLEDCRREIERLHDFFVDYYTGKTDDSSPMDAALAPEFEMVSPVGERLARADVVGMVRSKCDTYAPGAFDIAIRDVELVDGGPGWALARYEEHQTTPDGGGARLSTALFRAEPDAPLGLSWVTVHETRLETQ